VGNLEGVCNLENGFVAKPSELQSPIIAQTMRLVKFFINLRQYLALVMVRKAQQGKCNNNDKQNPKNRPSRVIF
jgi:hypothetical protein